MKSRHIFPGLLLTAQIFVPNPCLAQQDSTMPAPSAGATKPAAKTFSQQDLDQLLAPIALYPDSLLAQILMAATYPLEVVQAARWLQANPKVTGKALQNAMTTQTWDPAVKAMTAVPQVLQQMNDKLDWTQRLGDAFLAQQHDVMDTVQSLRSKAYAAGNLKSSEQQVVKTEVQGTQTIYVVQPATSEVVYVPTYNPTVVYGSWWYAAPPYFMYPPAYVYPVGVGFATGVVVGAAIWGNCNWGYRHGSVNVNVNNFNSFNKTTISNTNWNHNVEHRCGVAYTDNSVAQQYNRGSNLQFNQARDGSRGYSGSGGGMNADRDSASAARESFGGGGQAASRANDFSGGSAFSGLGNGAFTREASERGGANRADMGNFGGGDRFGGGRFGGESSHSFGGGFGGGGFGGRGFGRR